MFYAHTSGENPNNWQPLKNHLENTAKIAQEMGNSIGLSEHAKIIALFHDIGKYSTSFQKRLFGDLIRVDHSTAGAVEIKKLIQPSVLGTILAYCILGHHGGLPNYGSPIDDPSESTLCARLKRRIENFSEYKQEIFLSTKSLPNIKVIPSTKSGGFSISFLTRMLFSILVDADFLDTETFVNRGRKPRGGYESIPSLSTRYSQFLKRFEKPASRIDEYRNLILNKCLEKSNQTPGLFSLKVPTGGGKTYSSMAFALNHAVANNLNRIIYVIPYTSIIEQNAAVFKTSLGIENILEHHSNFDWNIEHQPDFISNPDYDDDDVSQKLKLASENYDIPIVVTTNVQFFESLFSDRPSKTRKIHNLTHSVIIFDEAQMIPRDFIKPCIYAVSELITNYGSSAVICTATNPNIEKFLPNNASLPVEIVENPEDYFEIFKRVNIVLLNSITDELLTNKLNDHDQVICIVNTRRHAKALFDKLEPQNRFHLSTLMCAAHRSSTLNNIRHNLDNGITCRLVSTQLVEAGVDIDFPTGYRALTGLDSIIQAAGRVNRNLKQSSGILYIFEPDTPVIKRIPAYIQQGADVARNILRDFDKDSISLEAIQAYYQQIYSFHDEKAFDRENIIGCFDKPSAHDAEFDFKTAAENFHLIEDRTVAVIINFDKKAERLLQKMKNSSFPNQFIRNLQPYTVNIFEQEFQNLMNMGKIDVYHKSFFVLNDQNFYDFETGIKIPEKDIILGEAIIY